MSHRATVSTRNARLTTDFGEDLARKWFGNDVFDSIETKYVRGKNEGKPKGEIAWVKVERGGWVSEGPDQGFVASPGMKCAILLDGYGDAIARKRFDPEGNGVLYFAYKLWQHVEHECFRFGKMKK